MSVLGVTYLGRRGAGPASDEFIISSSLIDDKVGIIKITDSKGEIVFSDEVTAADYSKKIDSKSWANGIYLIQVHTDNGLHLNAKVIINHLN